MHVGLNVGQISSGGYSNAVPQLVAGYRMTEHKCDEDIRE
jgi:hypothetical protein